MNPIGHHVSLRLVDGRVIAPSVSARRALSASVLRVAGPVGLLAFRGSDTHLHLLLLYGLVGVVEVIRRVRIGLAQVLELGAPFGSPRIEVVRRQEHLENAFRYVLRQDKHHGFSSDPVHEASCAPDLLGLRLVDGHLRPRLAEHLPRQDERSILRCLDLPPLRAGHDPEAMLGCTHRAVQKVARASVPQPLLRAVSLRAGLREHLAQRAALPVEPGWGGETNPSR